VTQPASIRHDRLGGGNRILEAETLVPLPLAEVFAFFAEAGNLQRITPPELAFHIETPLPVKMATGTVLDYRLRLAGVPFRWRSRISLWDPPFRFLDEQLMGPYAEWIHLHTFEVVPEGTRVRDRVRYRLPLHPVGLLVAPLVTRQLHRIFSYRERAVRELLGERNEGTRLSHRSPS
jgi:ligand-binding SRPBCC domain-containing protein